MAKGKLNVQLGLDTKAFEQGMRQSLNKLRGGSLHAGNVTAAMMQEARYGGMSGIAGMMRARVGLATGAGVTAGTAAAIGAAVGRELRMAMGRSGEYRTEAMRRGLGVGELPGVPGATQRYVREAELMQQNIQDLYQALDAIRNSAILPVIQLAASLATDFKRAADSSNKNKGFVGQGISVFRSVVGGMNAAARAGASAAMGIPVPPIEYGPDDQLNAQDRARSNARRAYVPPGTFQSVQVEIR